MIAPLPVRALLRRALATGAAAIVAAATLPAAGADGFPARPVRMIVASAPGGGTDIIARHLAQSLGEQWREQTVVDNRAGGGGAVATELVVRATADGHTLLVQSFGIASIGALRRGLPFDVRRDLAPVALLATQPSLVAVHAALPATTMAELVQLARNRTLQYGTSGAGGASHLASELLARAAGVRFTAVQYKGIAPAFTALLGGEIQIALVPVSTALPQLGSGRIRALAVTGAARSPLAPEIPTVREAGVAGYAFDAWYGLFAPAALPPALAETINAAVERALAAPALRARMAGAGIEPLGGPRAQFQRYFAAEVAKWSTLVADAGIRAD